MGVTSSKSDDDKPLQLCRERKKFIRQALDDRCALAAAHISYIQSLRSTGTALRKFVQPDVPVESSLYTSTSATPEPLALTEKSYSHFSFSPPSGTQHVEPNEHLSPSPSSTFGHYQVHHMKFEGSFTRKVEERPPEVVRGTATALSTSENTTPHVHDRAEPSPSESPTHQPESPTHQRETPPWDFFGLSHPNDNHLSSQEQTEVDLGFESNDNFMQFREEKGVIDLGDDGEKVSSNQSQISESDDEFDEPSSDTLVRSFKILNREESHLATDGSPTVSTAANPESENDLLNNKVNSPKLSPLKTSSEATVTMHAKVSVVEDGDIENKILPKDFYASMRDVEHLFVKASEGGKEVPRMLEANKLHFRPLLPGQESGESTSASLLKACFSCGDDPSQGQEELADASVKYLTWHRSASFRSCSSRNPFGQNLRDDVEDYTGDLFENFYKISGSHASTLDRLFAWERKLYDEVKASQLVRKDYDRKCKLLREQESSCASQNKIDKTRATIKDLHSRIRIAIHRIDSISRKIEEMRDKELQPQLEELIEGLRRMWEVMWECHKFQVHIISVASSNGNTKLLQTESRRHSTVLLEHELSNLSLSFNKWTNSLKSYVQSINGWLHKCISLEEKSSKKRRWAAPLQLRLRNAGPPIYTTCGVWLESLKEVQVKEVVETIKALAAEISRLIPGQEIAQGKKTHGGTDQAADMLTPHESYEERNMGCDHFRQSLVIFLSQICKFAECSVKMYVELRNNVEEAKRNYEHKMSQP